MTKPLSPAAQVVLDAAKVPAGDFCLENVNEIAAAALRALADQVVPEVGAFLSPGTAAGIRADILAIATELENAP